MVSTNLLALIEGSKGTVGTILDRQGIAIRAGHHCSQPVMDHFGVTGTARASLGLYSSSADIDALIDGLELVKSMFG